MIHSSTSVIRLYWVHPYSHNKAVTILVQVLVVQMFLIFRGSITDTIELRVCADFNTNSEDLPYKSPSQIDTCLV